MVCTPHMHMTVQALRRSGAFLHRPGRPPAANSLTRALLTEVMHPVPVLWVSDLIVCMLSLQSGHPVLTRTTAKRQ